MAVETNIFKIIVTLFWYFISTCDSDRIWTLYLKIISKVYKHFAKGAQAFTFLTSEYFYLNA